jgi:hypothetical protein
MTLHTNDDELVISMERFAGELEKVDCTDNITMQFTSQSTYQSAIAEWDWVNVHGNRTFILVTNYAGCGADESRDPWVVNNAYYDDPNHTVYLNATKETWEEVAHTYSMDFGRYSMPDSNSVTTNLTKRLPDINKSKTFTIPLAKDLPKDFLKPKTISGITIGLACTDCATKGSIELAGHVESSKKGLAVFTVDMTPSAVSADISLTLSAKGALTNAWDQSWTIIAATMPGYSIPGVLTIGPNLKFDGGLALSQITGSVGITAGMTATIPATSKANLDFVGKKTDIAGWVPEIKGKPVIFNAEVDAEFQAYLQLALAASLTCLGSGFSVDLALKLPEISIKGEVAYSTCSLHLS